MSVIDVKHLTKDYGFGRGVFDVSFQVEKGEVLGFLGPNGAGKSTTIRHLMGFSRPDRGETRIFGKESFHKYNEILSSVGYIPGEIALPAGLTGWEFLRMMQDMQGHRNKKKLDELLGLFELDPSGDTKRMSLGVKRKLAVVTAFMNDPDVLILDEPTSGLDPLVRDEIVGILNDFTREESHSILISSHIVSDLEKICDYIAFLHKGKLMLCDEKDRLLERYGLLQTTPEILRDLDASAVLGKRVTDYGAEAIVARDKVPQSFEIQPVSIEELFIIMAKEA